MEYTDINNILSELLWLPTKRARDIEKNKYLAISKIYKANTRFGQRIILEITGQSNIFMPSSPGERILQDENIFKKLQQDADIGNLYFKITEQGNIHFNNKDM